MAYDVRPVTADRWDELAAFFGPSGAYSGCWCTWWRQPAKDFDAGCRDGAAGNRALLERLTRDGATPGLLAHAGGEPVGWVTVAPRPEFGRILRSPTLQPPSLDSPDDDPADPAVWSVPCFWVPRARRGQGVASALLAAAVVHARAHGARTLEGYPVEVAGRAAADSIYTGTVSLFTRAGFTVVRRPPTGKRVVARRPTTEDPT